MRNIVFILTICVLLCCCRTQKHTVIQTEQQTQTTATHTGVQTLLSFDSLLQTVNVTADSVVIQLPSAGNAEGSHTTSAAKNRNSEAPANEPTPQRSGRITIYRPQVSSTRTETNLAVAQTAEQDSAAHYVLANSHADNSKEIVGVASPMNGTAVVIIGLLAVLLIAAVFLWLFLRKYKIV